ncbi:ATP-binding protein [Cryobacterium melibiosiphilum]|uniref:ATP-binding protein n=1 Tax=Cryobacterium melibiosiphilum TaxID=995039 RepID=A0A3A5ML08_9MICO|nr:ATP-binding protein [Cryobacterium melibiosiphilum]
MTGAGPLGASNGGPPTGSLFTGPLPTGATSTGEQQRNPISRAQIETVLYRSVAGVSLIFALQSVPAMLAQFGERRPVGAFLVGLALALSILSVVIATLVRRGVRTTTTIVASVYVLALVAWPFLMLDRDAVLDGKPWIWYLCTVATSCAAIAFPLRWAAIYTVVIPVMYGIVRILPAGGQAELALALLDVVYASLLGAVVLIIIYMLRQATEAVDVAQSNALQKYALAVRQHATEVERVEVDSIVHDTVLATLLSAAGAHTPKGAELAATMARNAIARLDEAGAEPTDDVGRVPFSRLAGRIRQAAGALACTFTVTEKTIEPLTMPEQASEALYSATVQAMVNSMQHAGPIDGSLGRTVTMGATLIGGATIEISDAGVGFDLASVSSGRLGLRLSIQGRVESAGGTAEVRSSPGRGTTIAIHWPTPVLGADLDAQHGASA